MQLHVSRSRSLRAFFRLFGSLACVVMKSVFPVQNSVFDQDDTPSGHSRVVGIVPVPQTSCAPGAVPSRVTVSTVPPTILPRQTLPSVPAIPQTSCALVAPSQVTQPPTIPPLQPPSVPVSC